jgi:DNA-binding transcriptional ArsR family regulator
VQLGIDPYARGEKSRLKPFGLDIRSENVAKDSYTAAQIPKCPVYFGPAEPRKAPNMADAGREKRGRKKAKKRRATGKKGRKMATSGRQKKSDALLRARLISAIAHPLRRRILRALAESGEERSPAQLGREFDLAVGSISYHLNVLRKLSVVKPVGERMVRGAVEHFYESTIEDDPPIEALLEETRAVDEEDA